MCKQLLAPYHKLNWKLHKTIGKLHDCVTHYGTRPFMVSRKIKVYGKLLQTHDTGTGVHTVRGVLFMTLYFHKFCENCVIRENLIRELQYLRWNVILAIGTKKEVHEKLNVNYQLATDS